MKKHLLLCASGLLLLTACTSSNKLDPVTAKQLLDAKYGKVYHLRISTVDLETAKQFIGSAAEQKGLVTIGPMAVADVVNGNVLIRLTKAGNVFSVPGATGDSTHLDLILADRKVDSLTVNPAADDPQHTTKATYTVIYSNPTPFIFLDSTLIGKSKPRVSTFAFVNNEWTCIDK